MRICYIADGRSAHFHRWIAYAAGSGNQMFFISYQPVEPADIQQIEASGAKYLGTLGAFRVKRFWLTLKDLNWLKATLRKNQIEAVHCHFLGVNTWYSALARVRPLIITVMGGGDVCGPDWQPQGWRERLFTPLALKKADAVTSWSWLMANVVRPYCRPEIPIEVVHGGIKLELFSPGEKPAYLLERWSIPADARVVFSPRLMRPLSNIDQIAHAANIVCAADPKAHFVFAYPTYTCDPDCEAAVREIIQFGPAADRTHFIGAIPHAEMADHYRLADVTVSIPGTDGTPMSVLESMACGVPVVIGDIPDYDPSYFESGKTALAVEPSDPSAIASAILRFFNDAEVRDAIVAEARRRVVATGSYESQMARMDALYKVVGRQLSHA